MFLDNIARCYSNNSIDWLLQVPCVAIEYALHGYLYPPSDPIVLELSLMAFIYLRPRFDCISESPCL